MTDGNQSGGVNFKGEKIDVGQDVVGRDKIVQNIAQYLGPNLRRSELPNQPYFFGRKDKLDQISETLDPRYRGWGAVIDGPGGIGKTALAIKAGHEASNDVFPTKIFLSAKERELTPEGELSLDDFALREFPTLLSELARKLGEDKIAVIEPSERARRVNLALETRQALLIMDNIDTFSRDDQNRLFGFLNFLPQSCKAIVTSREPLPDVVKPIHLGKLNLYEAKELIAKLSENNLTLGQATDAEIDLLYNTTNGNPLLLKWVSGQIGSDGSQCYTLEEACKYIERAPKGNDPLEYMFSDLLRTLNPARMNLLAILSYFRDFATVEWVAGISGVGPSATRSMLEDLVRRGLLESDRPQSFIMSHLVAMFLRKQSISIFRQVEQRIADYAFNLVLSNSDSNSKSFSVLDANWPVIVSALPLFEKTDYERKTKIISRLEPYLKHSMRFEELAVLAGSLEESAVTAYASITRIQTNVVQLYNSLPNQPFFFGRKEELAMIAEALDPQTSGWGVLISGPGGIGKTALAIHAGHIASEEKFPIKIYLSAKVGRLTPQGMKPVEDFMLPNYITLVTEVARELGDESIAKIDPNLRANEVRRLLADKRVLLVIDNLETLDETERARVFQFLSRLPRSCKAIVTSRRRIDTPAEIIRLDKLERDDALKLIARIAERNHFVAKTTGAERINLYEMTNGNPLLIEWLAGQLGRPSSQLSTIIEAAKFMENAPKDNDPLEFVFGDLLDTFTEHETVVLAALTYFTLPAKLKWIAEIAQITTTQAETALEDLADRSILVVGEITDSSTKESRSLLGYLLPPLTATFLRRARPEVIAQAGSNLAGRAYALAQENGYSKYDRFPILEAEWPTIAAAIPLILQGDNHRLQRLCYALMNFLNFTGRWDEWLALNLQAEERALVAKDTDSAGWRAYHAGWVCYLRGQSAEVLACAGRAAVYWAPAGAQERANASQLHGFGYELARDYPAAIMAYHGAVDLWRTFSRENEGVVNGLGDIARVERMSGDLVAAEQDYREALWIAKKVNYLEGVAYMTGNLAGLALDRKQWAEAEQLAREALLLSEDMGRLQLVASNCMRIAQACARQGRPAEGLPYAQRAVAIFTKLRSPDLAEAQAILKECEG